MHGTTETGGWTRVPVIDPPLDLSVADLESVMLRCTALVGKASRVGRVGTASDRRKMAMALEAACREIRWWLNQVGSDGLSSDRRSGSHAKAGD